MANLNHLFQPGRIGTMDLKNRLIMAPMLTCTADAEGYVNDRTIEFYAQRAKGGVGLIISQLTEITPGSRSPGRLWCFDDKYIPKLRSLSHTIHQHGAKVALQLAHPGRALTDLGAAYFSGPWSWSREGTIPERPDETEAVAPSPVPLITSDFPPKEATKNDIEYLESAFAEAARRARDAGFDAVEIHAAHGYLISSFLSPGTNRRTDEYGGNRRNRARFACEVIARVRDKVGDDFPIILRVNGSDFLRGGTTIEDTLVMAPLFVEAGADALEISGGTLETYHYLTPNYLQPDGAFVSMAEAVKKVVNVPVIAVGKIGDPVLANLILEEGKADFISMGRPLFADPELPNKAKEGRLDQIRRCIFCNNCNTRTASEIEQHGGRMCTVNPELAREREFALKPAPSPQNIMVIGGGLAGMEAARTLALRGHHVSLFEKSEKLGGQWNIACLQEGKRNHYPWFTKFLSQALYDSGAKVYLSQEATPELVTKIAPDVVILASGASPRPLDLPGINSNIVVQAIDVILGNAGVGNRVVVVGGRLIGMEVALSLAKQGKRVSLITLHNLGENGTTIDRTTFRILRDGLIQHGVFIYPNSPLVEVKDGGVFIACNRELVFLEADSVVLAVGYKANDELFEKIKNIVPRIFLVGDCAQPRDALDAVKDGAEIGRQI